jgi:hypothetical protein
VASSHSKYTLKLMAELAKKHGLDYEAHDVYRFAEK